MVRTQRDLALVILARQAAEDGRARAERRKRKVRLREVGELVGRSTEAVHLWETGQRVPTGQPALLYGRLIASWLAESEAAAS